LALLTKRGVIVRRHSSRSGGAHAELLGMADALLGLGAFARPPERV